MGRVDAAIRDARKAARVHSSILAASPLSVFSLLLRVLCDSLFAPRGGKSGRAPELVKRFFLSPPHIPFIANHFRQKKNVTFTISTLL